VQPGRGRFTNCELAFKAPLVMKSQFVEVTVETCEMRLFTTFLARVQGFAENSVSLFGFGKLYVACLSTAFFCPL
jgi:hypothetical protein